MSIRSFLPSFVGTTAFVLVIFCLRSADADEIRVAAASSLQRLLTDTARSFESEQGHRVILIFGSSGNLVSQILQGAPYDVFFSADAEYVSELESAQVTLPNSSLPYAKGQLVLWTLKESRIDPRQGFRQLADLTTGKVAVANPAHAPYGRAAVEAMKHYGIYDQLQNRLVFGENVLQAAQFAETGAAVAGIIAMSLAVVDRMNQSGTYWEIPQESYTSLTQVAVVLKSSRHPDAARQFVDYFSLPEIRNRLPEYGFLPPD